MQALSALAHISKSHVASQEAHYATQDALRSNTKEAHGMAMQKHVIAADAAKRVTKSAGVSDAHKKAHADKETEHRGMADLHQRAVGESLE